MIQKVVLISAIIGLSSCRKIEKIAPEFYNCNFTFSDSSLNHVHNEKYQMFLDDMTSKGVVGVMMSVYNPDHGMWVGSSGNADIHNGVKMKPCNITRVGSIVKMFTATVVLKLQEEGKFDLDDKISDYLTEAYIDKIENADKATIRQLLQHSSGIHNYIQNLKFQTASINDLIREWSAEDLMKYSFNQDAYFQPGEDVRYSNTGYILLGLLIEKMEGKPLYQVFEEKIFDPLNMSLTSFAGENPVPDGIVRGYIDMYSNLQVMESTYFSGWDYYTADGGLISNPYDLNVYFQALMNGQLINSNSLNEMLSWKVPVNVDSEFFPISYGLGIFKIETDFGPAYMHSGDAIGYNASMMHFPQDTITVAFAVNSNYGKIDQYVSSKEALENLFILIHE